LNHRALFAYDGLNRLIQLTDPGLGQTRYRYDGQNRLIQVTDPRDLRTIYTVDGLGNRLQQQSPDTGQTTSTQDAAGNEVTRTDAKGQVTQLCLRRPQPSDPGRLPRRQPDALPLGPGRQRPWSPDANRGLPEQPAHRQRAQHLRSNKAASSARRAASAA
jgi:YD repeat-containing protein